MKKPMHSTTITTRPMAFKAKQFKEVMKLRLSGLVVFSGGFGFLLAVEDVFYWGPFIALLIGSLLITGAANTINQIIERDLDKLMKRTAGRPMPTGGLSVTEAIIFAVVLTALGTAILAIFVNLLAASLSLFSLILYAFVYTPLKQITPLSVLVGAFPGAFPPLIGWVGMTGEISTEAIIIYGIQFFWQFPHFWAIAWVANDDYNKAGFKMLPYGKSLQTATQIMIYTLFLVPLSILPFQVQMIGVTSAIIAGVASVLFLALSFVLIKKQTNKAAKQIMFASFFYLPIIQIAYLLDKI
ncbi:MAG: heme o synthase [Flammeovirgaceae bacterium]